MRHAWLLIAPLVVAGCAGKKPVPATADEPPAGAAVDENAARNKAVEAHQGLQLIYDGARSYYMDESPDSRSDTPLPKQFPQSAPMTPPLGECCKGAAGACEPTLAWWETPSWNALMFSRDDPHHYSYEFISAGTDYDASFTVRAMGDLDCDGIYSTFEMAGRVTPSGIIERTRDVTGTNELE